MESLMSATSEDREDILQLLYAYNHAIDGGDAEGWAAMFVEDGALEAAGRVFSGRHELTGFARGVHGMRHVVANPVVELSGDSARVDAYVIVYRGLTPTVIGTYEDSLVRKPEGWRFTRRVFRPDSWDGAATETLDALAGDEESGPG
jgi:hypothetical protein